MCAVIGYCGKPVDKDAAKILAALMREGLARGTHATGWACSEGSGAIVVRKRIGTGAVDDVASLLGARIVIGHCRYSTSGDWTTLDNNQPVAPPGWALVFNGIVSMGTKEEFQRQFNVQCQTDNDGEVILRKIEQGADPIKFLRAAQASFAGCWTNGTTLWALRNWKRPLWKVTSGNATWVASTRDLFERAGLGMAQSLLPDELCEIKPE